MSGFQRILFFLLAVGVLATGCQNETYYWGHYENLVYVSYAKPGKVSPEMQVSVMEQDMQKASSENKPLPPGFHAHLGYEYYLCGKPTLALQQFEKEKAEFPESSVFMDRMIAALTKK
jgi:hypothetical protein